MKVTCKIHGAHFGDEINDIVQCPEMWTNFGLTNLPVDGKTRLTEWLVTMPSDEIYIETGWGIKIALSGDYIGYENGFNQLPGYENMTDPERREWQRNLIKQELKIKEHDQKWYKRLMKK